MNLKSSFSLEEEEWGFDLIKDFVFLRISLNLEDILGRQVNFN